MPGTTKPREEHNFESHGALLDSVLYAAVTSQAMEPKTEYLHSPIRDEKRRRGGGAQIFPFNWALSVSLLAFSSSMKD